MGVKPSDISMCADLTSPVFKRNGSERVQIDRYAAAIGLLTTSEVMLLKHSFLRILNILENLFQQHPYVSIQIL